VSTVISFSAIEAEEAGVKAHRSVPNVNEASKIGTFTLAFTPSIKRKRFKTAALLTIESINRFCLRSPYGKDAIDTLILFKFKELRFY
jgi:hypothetical protein